MFGKKQQGASQTPPARKSLPVTNDAPIAEKPVVESPAEKEPSKAPEPVPAAVERIAEPKPEKPVKKSKASGEAVAEDTLLAHEDIAEEVVEGPDNMTALRLQRARNRIWLDLRDGIDLKALARMKAEEAREEVRSAVEEIARFRNLDITPTELAKVSKECADDMLGFGPLEELLERDDIADIMINGPETTYIEVGGKIERSRIKFRDNQHLTTICQRIVGAIGRVSTKHHPYVTRVCLTVRV
jgi:pilus assembly protein CpaF